MANMLSRGFHGLAALGLTAGFVMSASPSFAACQSGDTCVTVPLQIIDGANGSEVSATGFRWLVELDTSHPVTPGVSVDDSLGVDNHAAHAPVIDSGTCDAASCTISFPDRPLPAEFAKFKQDRTRSRYYVSVLPPTAEYTMGGTQIVAGQTTEAKVIVRRTPLPTAQISIHIFQDNWPLNGAPDVPAEVGLCNFKIYLEEPAGRYGANGGQVQFDAFGNPLGTEYDAQGNVTKMGTGVIYTGCGADDLGVVRIKNLSPGKYGVRVEAPQGSGWQQTSTIEGSPVIDAWVKAGEPPFFTEFGPPGHHVFIGMTKEFVDPALNGGHTVAGQIHNAHQSRPPEVSFHDGGPYHEFNGASPCWVGLNSGGGTGRTLAVQRCDADSRFSFANVPPGSYQLAIFDQYLDIVIGFHNFVVAEDGTCGVNALPCSNLGAVPVFNWFGRLENVVFHDINQNGIFDDGEPTYGADSAVVNMRFRDGSLYQTFATDGAGSAPFDQVFPFFHWMVAEISPGFLKATGITTEVDAGGPVDTGDILRRQVQEGGATSRTETGEVLTQAVQTYLGTTNRIWWGKTQYNHLGAGENGGITGVIAYATTRAEDDPEAAAWDTWEPGVPRVQVELYWDANRDNVIDDLDGDGTQTRSDVDNWPFGNFPSSEDIDHNGNRAFDPGDAIMLARSDSWDDNQPSGCPANPGIQPGQQNPFYIHGDPNRTPPSDCFEGLRTYNQIRPGVFDGGYAFKNFVDGGLANKGIAWGADPFAALEAYVESGVEPVKSNLLWDTSARGFTFFRNFVVGAATPKGYRHYWHGDKNVDFGESYVPAPTALPPGCVGTSATVPQYQTLFPGEQVPVAAYPSSQPQCDLKSFQLAIGQNGGVDFHLMTEVPRAGRLVGFILNDFAQEFDPTSPAFGEKFAPSWIPFTIRDYAGTVIYRGYSDEWGKYNALVPSTYTMNRPLPSGASPNMLTACLNDPGPIDRDPVTGEAYPSPRTDPFWLRQYTQFCYTFEYMPGVTTYLDTPVQPVAAFTNTLDFPMDCECENGTPAIDRASGPTVAGPWVAAAGQVVTIMSQGNVEVPNPAFVSGGAQPRVIARDFGFGSPSEGAITVTFDGQPLASTFVQHVDASMIRVTVPTGTPDGSYPVSIKRANGKSTKAGITIHVGTFGGTRAVHVVSPSTDPDATPIQNAIDLASAGDIILVTPGTYEEHVILYKNVVLQGAGEGSTHINAVRGDGRRVQRWRDKVNALYDAGAFDVIPPQNAVFNLPNNEGGVFSTEEGATIVVVGKMNLDYQGGRIDGLTLQGSDNGGGIVVNAYGHGLAITNNVIRNNSGVYGGGVRIGNPEFAADPDNDAIVVTNNRIIENGANSIGGGGVAVFAGTDEYSVSQNWICGNFTAGNGGGVSHVGLSQNGDIANNQIIFNQSFAQGTPQHGGGIFVAGQQIPGALTEGSGTVTIAGNLIHGNNSGAGDGSGIRLQYINGADVENGTTHEVHIVNNIITNNVAGMAGAVSMLDAVKVVIAHNTITNNDSTATAGAAFAPGQPPASMVSDPQPAGVVAYANSEAGLNGLGYSNPMLVNNVIRHNRSFKWQSDQVIPDTIFLVGGLLPDVAGGDAPVYEDLAVLGQTACLSPQYSILGSANRFDRHGCSYAASNRQSDGELFVAEYANVGKGNFNPTEPGTGIGLQAVPALDEGGNFIEVRYGPLTLLHPVTGEPFSDYHLSPAGALVAVDAGQAMNQLPPLFELASDYDGDNRPQGSGPDIGADETSGVVACVPTAIPEVGYVANNYAPHGRNGIDEDCNGIDLTFQYLLRNFAGTGSVTTRSLQIRVVSDHLNYVGTPYLGQPVTATVTYGNGSQANFALTWQPTPQRYNRIINNFVATYGIPTQIATTGPEGTMVAPVVGVPNTIRSVTAAVNTAGRLQVRANSDFAAKALLQVEVTYYHYGQAKYLTQTWPMAWDSGRWNYNKTGFVAAYGMPVRVRVFGPEGSVGPVNVSGARPPVPLAAR